MATVRSLDVVLPVKAQREASATELRLRLVARPDRPLADLLRRLGLALTSAPKAIQNSA